MKTGGIPQEGFRSTAPHKPRKPRDEARYPWVLTPEGRCAKFIIMRLAEDMIEGMDAATIDRQFKEHGLGTQKLYDDFIRFCPEFPAEYLRVRGTSLTVHIVWDRFHKAYYVNGKSGKGGKPFRSREHYTESPRLRPIISACEKAYKERKPLTLEQMKNLGK
jgi:hypothetical protein